MPLLIQGHRLEVGWAHSQLRPLHTSPLQEALLHVLEDQLAPLQEAPDQEAPDQLAPLQEAPLKAPPFQSVSVQVTFLPLTVQ